MLVDDLCCTLPTNQTICNQHGGSDWIIEKGYLQGDFLAINRDNGTLTWYSPYGIKINRTYSFPRTPLHAIFCLFDTHDVGAVASSQTSETAAVAILVNEFELQIHYESGEKFEILLPVAVNNIFSTPVGILLQVSRSHYAKMISGLTAAHSVPSLALSSHHLLIRTPRSPIEFIPSSLGTLNPTLDCSIISVRGSNVCLFSPSNSSLLVYDLVCSNNAGHLPLEANESHLDSHPLSLLDTTNTTHSSEHLSATSPFFDASRSQSGILNLSHSSKRSSLPPRAPPERMPSVGAAVDRSSPRTISSSPTPYDSETLQSLLGVKSQAKFPRQVKGSRPSTSSYSKRSVRSHSPTKGSASLLEDNDEVELDGLQGCLATSASWRLELISTICLVDFIPADSPVLQHGDVIVQLINIDELDPYATVFVSPCNLYLQVSLGRKTQCLSQLSYSTMERATMVSVAVPLRPGQPSAPTSSLDLTLFKSIHSNQMSMVITRSVGSLVFQSIDINRTLSCLSLSSHLPFVAFVTTDRTTHLVHLECSQPRSTVMVNFLAIFSSQLDKFPKEIRLALLMTLRSLIAIESVSIQVILWWVGLLMGLPYNSLRDFYLGSMALSEIIWNLTIEQFDNLRELLVSVDLSSSLKVVQETLRILHLLYQENCLRNAANDSTQHMSISTMAYNASDMELLEAVSTLQDVARYSIGRGYGDLKAWNHSQLLDCVSQFTTDRLTQWMTALFTNSADMGLISPPKHSIFLATRLLLAWKSHLEDGALQVNAALKVISALVEAVREVCGDAESDFVRALRLLPAPIRWLCAIAFRQVTSLAPANWPRIVLKWVGREDLAANQSHTAPMPPRISADKYLDGLAEVEDASLLRFPEDDRLHEACRLLRSSVPLYLKMERAPEDSELERRQKIQLKLVALTKRSLAVAVGRGMMTIGTMQPVMAEALPIPTLALCGRLPPANTIVQLDPSVTTPEHMMWPEFHNGVAAALRITGLSGGLAKVTRNWILYNKATAVQNKTASSTDQGHAHAGFLLGLGLLGHLQVLSIPDICDYLTQGQESTTVAILIGVAASKLGSADTLFSKTLCLHLPSLLPSQHWDIEISPVVQCSALVGLGLLYYRSGHRLMVEFLLEELSRKPTSDRCEHREALALAAAWALALVLLPSEDSQDHVLRDLSDLAVDDRLFALIKGGERPIGPKIVISDDNPSDTTGKPTRILETSQINTDITSPAACLALGLIFQKSKDTKVLRFLQLPQTYGALEAIRPDLLLSRSMALALVEWSMAEPTNELLESLVPKVVREGLGPEALKARASKYAGPYGHSRNAHAMLSPSTSFLLYIHIITGHCLGLGLIHAGSFHPAAKAVILEKLKYLQSVRDGKGAAQLGFTLDKGHKVALDMCLGTLSLALAAVLAGSGDLDAMRTIRELRWKADDVTYGTHMAFSMAMGLLFLAAGRYSLQRDPLSIACLALSLFPRYPSRTQDQQFHLQALRHLYVFAAEPRVLQSIDVDTGLPVGVDLEIELVSGEKVVARAPGLLPELATVRSIKVVEGSGGLRYYPCTVQLEKSGKMSEASGGGEKDDTGMRRRLWESRKRGGLRTMKHSALLAPLYVKRWREKEGWERVLLEDDSCGTACVSDDEASDADHARRQLFAKLFDHNSEHGSVNRKLSELLLSKAWGAELLTNAL